VYTSPKNHVVSFFSTRCLCIRVRVRVRVEVRVKVSGNTFKSFSVKRSFGQMSSIPAWECVRKNGHEWDSNLSPYQPEKYPGIKVATILEHKKALDQHSGTVVLC